MSQAIAATANLIFDLPTYVGTTTKGQILPGSDVDYEGVRPAKAQTTMRHDVRSDGRVKKHAFLPRNSGKDRDGLSVSILDQQYASLHREKYEQPKKATASIVVGDVTGIGLRVVAAPEDSDPRHALITGIPDPTLGDSQKKEAERFAQLLADQARVYSWP